MNVPENCPPPLVGLEFDSDSSSEMERISHCQHIKVYVYGKTPVKTRARTLLTRRSQSLAARLVRSRSLGGRSQEGRRSMSVAMPSPPILQPSRRGRIRSQRSVAGENSCTYPTHSPLAEPRGSLGAVAIARSAAAVGRRKVAGQCAVGRRSLCPHHKH